MRTRTPRRAPTTARPTGGTTTPGRRGASDQAKPASCSPRPPRGCPAIHQCARRAHWLRTPPTHPEVLFFPGNLQETYRAGARPVSRRPRASLDDSDPSDPARTQSGAIRGGVCPMARLAAGEGPVRRDTRWTAPAASASAHTPDHVAPVWPGAARDLSCRQNCATLPNRDHSRHRSGNAGATRRPTSASHDTTPPATHRATTRTPEDRGRAWAPGATGSRDDVSPQGPRRPPTPGGACPASHRPGRHRAVVDAPCRRTQRGASRTTPFRNADATRQPTGTKHGAVSPAPLGATSRARQRGRCQRRRLAPSARPQWHASRASPPSTAIGHVLMRLPPPLSRRTRA